MTDIAKVRRSNLLRLRNAKFRTIEELAKAVGRSSQQISSMLTGNKSFGSKIARDIEAKLNLKEGILDEVHEPHAIEKESLSGGRMVPVLSFVQAGPPTETGQNSYDEQAFYTGEGERVYALRIRGDSMEPEFSAGDMVFVDPDLSARPGDFVVARLANSDNEATIKRYAVTGYDEYGRDVFELRPLNPLYPTLRSDELEIQLVGVVTEKRTSYR